MKKLRGLFVVVLALGGCSAVGRFPHGATTRVDLSKKNYRVVKANAIGSSVGFSLLGIIPIVPPRYTKAMKALYAQIGPTEQRAVALTNVIEERSTIYLILFSFPKLTIRADVIEFTEGSERK